MNGVPTLRQSLSGISDVNITGDLTASTFQTTTQGSYLGGITSNVQTQINALTMQTGPTGPTGMTGPAGPRGDNGDATTATTEAISASISASTASVAAFSSASSATAASASATAAALEASAAADSAASAEGAVRYFSATLPPLIARQDCQATLTVKSAGSIVSIPTTVHSLGQDGHYQNTGGISIIPPGSNTFSFDVGSEGNLTASSVASATVNATNVSATDLVATNVTATNMTVPNLKGNVTHVAATDGTTITALLSNGSNYFDTSNPNRTGFYFQNANFKTSNNLLQLNCVSRFSNAAGVADAAIRVSSTTGTQYGGDVVIASKTLTSVMSSTGNSYVKTVNDVGNGIHMLLKANESTAAYNDVTIDMSGKSNPTSDNQGTFKLAADVMTHQGTQFKAAQSSTAQSSITLKNTAVNTNQILFKSQENRVTNSYDAYQKVTGVTSIYNSSGLLTTDIFSGNTTGNGCGTWGVMASKIDIGNQADEILIGTNALGGMGFDADIPAAYNFNTNIIKIGNGLSKIFLYGQVISMANGSGMSYFNQEPSQTRRRPLA